ncbi:Actin-like protein arp9 [Clarireedia jacksonii]
MPPFKDEHILIIAPGSQTTLAQLGLPESFTQAQRRFPTRMFPAPDGKTYEPYKIRPRKKDATAKADTEMGGVSEEKPDEEEELEELPEDDEGAIWPLKEGRIENFPAFCAFLQHVHNQLSPTLHTPIMLIAQPSWTAKNHEDLTQFIFEKFKTPALCIMDSALATSYAFGIPNSTIIDVGFEKIDVTAITDFQISGRGNLPASGGEAMTLRLMELLKSKGFTRDMAEQLKRSPICEILPSGTPLPGTEETADIVSNPAAAASTGATASGPNVKIAEAPRGPGLNTEVGEEDGINGVDVTEEDGVLDVASIVASGKTQEYLAKIEKEKAGKLSKKAQKDKETLEAAAAKPVRLPNSKRPRATFHYESSLPEPSAKRAKSPEPTSAPTANEANPSTEETKATEEAQPPTETATESAPSADAPAPAVDGAVAREQAKTARKQKAWEEEHPDRMRRDIEIGVERFQAASETYMDAIADTVYRTILSVDDISKRQDAWDSLVICGSGSKVRGFKDALITTLTNRYLISPSSATMFMSELPSNLATPSGTGSMTPNASFSSTPHPVPSASAVNPLLLAATTASNPALNPNVSVASFNGAANAQHSSHSQSPTSIKVASPPTYFPEWKSYEEAVFLGSQIAAKVIFVVDQGLSKGFLSRVDFNEEGPTAIHQVGLVY